MSAVCSLHPYIALVENIQGVSTILINSRQARLRHQLISLVSNVSNFDKRHCNCCKMTSTIYIRVMKEICIIDFKSWGTLYFSRRDPCSPRENYAKTGGGEIHEKMENLFTNSTRHKNQEDGCGVTWKQHGK